MKEGEGRERELLLLLALSLSLSLPLSHSLSKAKNEVTDNFEGIYNFFSTEENCNFLLCGLLRGAERAFTNCSTLKILRNKLTHESLLH